MGKKESERRRNGRASERARKEERDHEPVSQLFSSLSSLVRLACCKTAGLGWVERKEGRGERMEVRGKRRTAGEGQLRERDRPQVALLPPCTSFSPLRKKKSSKDREKSSNKPNPYAIPLMLVLSSTSQTTSQRTLSSPSSSPSDQQPSQIQPSSRWEKEGSPSSSSCTPKEIPSSSPTPRCLVSCA